MKLYDIITIANDWATRCFGEEQMENPKTRAIRIVEEAIELAQAVGVDIGDIRHCALEVYGRDKGATLQEMGGVLMTAFLMTRTLGCDVEQTFLTELRRVLDKEAKNPGMFAKRNANKINLQRPDGSVKDAPYDGYSHSYRDPIADKFIASHKPGENELVAELLPSSWVPDEYDEGLGG